MKNSLSILFVTLLVSASLFAQTKSICVPTISLSGIYSGGVVSVDNLIKSNEIKVNCIGNPQLNYEVVSLKFYIVPKAGDAFMFNLYENKLKEDQIAYLSKINPEGRIYIEEVKVKTPDGAEILELPGYVVNVGN